MTVHLVQQAGTAGLRAEQPATAERLLASGPAALGSEALLPAATAGENVPAKRGRGRPRKDGVVHLPTMK